MMLTNKTKVLLVLTQDLLDRARVFAGKATTALKLPVSLQIVLRALIELVLKRDNHPALRANVEGQAKAVRHLRGLAGRRRPTGDVPPRRTTGRAAEEPGEAAVRKAKGGDHVPCAAAESRL